MHYPVDAILKKKIIIINTHIIEYLKFYDKYIFKKTLKLFIQ